MIYDLIIVSKSEGELIPMTQNCINTALQDGADMNIIVVESGEMHQYENAQSIKYNGEFNYNRALNLGLQHVKGDIHILANNDIIFHPGWSKIGEQMIYNKIHSASALSQDPQQSSFKEGNVMYEGYDIGIFLTGWCIFVDPYCIKSIGKLDETVLFWFSDDLYACQLLAVGIKHYLFCNVRVDHITSRTLIMQPIRLQRQYKIGEYQKFTLRKRFYHAKRKVIH